MLSAVRWRERGAHCLTRRIRRPEHVRGLLDLPARCGYRREPFEDAREGQPGRAVLNQAQPFPHQCGCACVVAAVTRDQAKSVRDLCGAGHVADLREQAQALLEGGSSGGPPIVAYQGAPCYDE